MCNNLNPNSEGGPQFPALHPWAEVKTATRSEDRLHSGWVYVLEIHPRCFTEGKYNIKHAFLALLITSIHFSHGPSCLQSSPAWQSHWPTGTRQIPQLLSAYLAQGSKCVGSFLRIQSIDEVGRKWKSLENTIQFFFHFTLTGWTDLLSIWNKVDIQHKFGVLMQKDSIVFNHSSQLPPPFFFQISLSLLFFFPENCKSLWLFWSQP